MTFVSFNSSLWEAELVLHMYFPAGADCFFNLAPSHMFGNRLNPNSAMAALIAQSEASPAGSLPGSGLGLLGAGGGETLPPVATSIEQLLERQWNEGQSFLLQQGAQGDVVGMLKSLHQLQEENHRLEEQIKTLTMKKERLQLLSAQLSVPFTPSSASGKVSRNVMLDSASCGGHSSSGSTSSLSTPPSVSQSPPQPQMNGVGALGAGVSGLMGALGAVGGIVGALNGVIQTPGGVHTTGASALTVNSRYVLYHGMGGGRSLWGWFRSQLSKRESKPVD
uniref:Uncharacterized protein n=1 Tax=Neogobius melanostomus TaxID=47308 RepID=A0A8C6S5I1_9GOBI